MGHRRRNFVFGGDVSKLVEARYSKLNIIHHSFAQMGMGCKKAPTPTPKLTINIYDIAKDTLSVNASTVDFPKLITPMITHNLVDSAQKSGNCDPDEITLCLDVQASAEKLEKSAALILSVLDTARDRGKKSVNWSRAEVNTLRKFLFILSSRNSLRWRRFSFSEGQNSEGDDQDTRDPEIERFRVRHGLRNARCAWLFSVHHLLETPHWRIPTNDRILQEDRREYEEDMRYRQLAIYETPRQEVGSGDHVYGPLECEFPLTESSLGMGEGKSTLATGDEGEEICFEQKMNLPRPYMSSSDQSINKARTVPLTKIYAMSPKLAIVLVHVEVALDGLDFDIVHTSNDSVFADFPKIPTQVSYRPPLAENALSFCSKEPALWTPEDIQRESDFRHHQILDGRIVYSRLADGLEFALHELRSNSVWVINQVLWQGCNEWIITEKADGMMEAMWEVRVKEGLLPDTITVCNAAGEKTRPEDGEIAEDDEPEDGVARYLPGLRGVFTWGREGIDEEDVDEDEDIRL